MKLVGKLAIAVIVFNVVSAFGQTRTQIEAKFGQPVNAYKVSERIWMSPYYAANGQVCRMVFYPRRASFTTTYLVNEFPFDEFRSAIDVVLPVATRGVQKEPFGDGSWKASAGGRWVDFFYERMTITYIANLPTVNAALNTGELVNLDLPDDEISKQQEKPKPIKQDFSLYSGSTAEIVVVRWNDRKCTGRL